ncbi:TPA: hypothetical protein RY444_004319 [Escherichia albertii]|nr:hypothetical protein [Escherichia albertii]
MRLVEHDKSKVSRKQKLLVCMFVKLRIKKGAGSCQIITQCRAQTRESDGTGWRIARHFLLHQEEGYGVIAHA